MARQSTDDKFTRDPRVDKLAMYCGWSRRETRACLQDVWALCYDRVVPYLPADDIEVTALRDAIAPPKHEKGFVGALLQSELGRPAVATDRYFVVPKGDRRGDKIPFADPKWTDKIYLAGARDHIGYLLNQKANGARGGAKSAEVRQNSGKGRLTDPTASLNRASSQGPSSLSLALPLASSLPLDPALAPVLDPEREKSARDRAKGSKPKRQLTALSDDWIPTRSEANEGAETEARSRGVHVRGQLDTMRDWVKANGVTRKDWDAQWRNWLRNSKPAQQQARPQQGDGLSFLLEEIRKDESRSS